MSQVRKAGRRLGSAALLVALTAGCGHSSPAKRSRSAAYLAREPGAAVLVRWTQTGRSLRGAVSTARIRTAAPFKVATKVRSFTGSINRGRVSLHVGRAGRASILAGRIRAHGRTLRLALRGARPAQTFSRASVRAYRRARVQLKAAEAQTRGEQWLIASAPLEVTPDYLVALSAQMGRSIFWLGPMRGRRLELSRADQQHAIAVRYLPRGVRVGASRDYLLVGAFRVGSPTATVRALAANRGRRPLRAPYGGVAFPHDPKTVYVAFPGTAVGAIVYSPTRGVARRLLGRLAPVDAPHPVR